MVNELDSQNLQYPLGTTSLVIGIIGLLFFFLPILAIPLSLFGMGFGVIGFTVAYARRQALRQSLAGITVSALALVVNLAIAHASELEPLPRRDVPRSWRPQVKTPLAAVVAVQETARGAVRERVTWVVLEYRQALVRTPASPAE